MREFKDAGQIDRAGNSMISADHAPSSKLKQKLPTDMSMQPSNNKFEDSQANLMTQTELFKQYSEQQYLYLNQTNEMFWFEFGGNKIGRLYIEGESATEHPNWRLVAKYKNEYACHLSIVFVNGGATGQNPLTKQDNKNVGSWFLLGGVGNNCLQYLD